MRSFRPLLFATVLLLLLLLFLSHTALATKGVQEGLSLFLETVFPALFPFLVLSEFMLFSGVGDMLGLAIARPMNMLFGVSRAGSKALLLGVLCGQPIASSTAISLYEKEEISKEEAQRISLFANNPSSGFLISAVGGALFGNTGVGIALFCITQLSAISLGIALRLFFGKAEEKEKKCHNGADKCPLSTLFTTAVQRAFSCVLQIGAFLIFFSALKSTLAGLLTSLPLPTKWHAWLFGCLEITAGIQAAANTLSCYSAIRLAAFLCGFGGVCVCFQILSISQKCDLRISSYLLAKLFQGCLALLFCEGYLRLFKPLLSPTQSVPASTFFVRLPTLSAMLVFLLVGILFKRRRNKNLQI